MKKGSMPVPGTGAWHQCLARVLVGIAVVVVSTFGLSARAAHAEDFDDGGWKGKIKAGVNYTDGTATATDAMLHAKGAYSWDKTKLTLEGEVRYGKSKGETNTDYKKASARYDWEISRISYLFTNVGLMNDRINNIDLRTTVGIGAGHHLIAEPKQTLDVEYGLEGSRDQIKDEKDTTDLFARIAGIYHLKLSDSADFSETLEIFPGLSDLNETRGRSETTLTTKITERVSTELRLVVDYDNEPAVTAENIETRVDASIGYLF
ncbi:MAG: DUF481 domain-containing protein [Candidatus Omnitrophica bacterium]|nr:DUF481 domain-containing protein [Candidatus Omnitrophota bacterium]